LRNVGLIQKVTHTCRYQRPASGALALRTQVQTSPYVRSLHQSPTQSTDERSETIAILCTSLPKSHARTYRSLSRPVWPTFVTSHRSVQEDPCCRRPPSSSACYTTGYEPWFVKVSEKRSCGGKASRRVGGRYRKGLSTGSRTLLATARRHGRVLGPAQEGLDRRRTRGVIFAVQLSHALAQTKTLRKARHRSHAPSGTCTAAGRCLGAGERVSRSYRASRD